MEDSEAFDEVGINWFRQNGIYYRHLTLSHKPPVYPLFWVYNLEYIPGVRTVSLHIDPVDSSKSIHQAKRFSLRKKLQNTLPNVGVLRHARNKLLQIFGKRSGKNISDEKSFNVSVYIQLHSKRKKSLDQLTDLVTSVAEEMEIRLEPIQNKHIEAFRSCEPLAQNQLDISFRMDVEATAATSFIFLEPLGVEKDSNQQD